MHTHKNACELLYGVGALWIWGLGLGGAFFMTEETLADTADILDETEETWADTDETLALGTVLLEYLIVSVILSAILSLLLREWVKLGSISIGLLLKDSLDMH